MSKRNRIVVVLAAAAVLLAGALWIVGRLGSPQTLTLEVSGDPGRKVVGTVEVDGVSQPLAGTLPARLEYRGSRIAYALAPVDGKPREQITVKTSVDGRPSYECLGSVHPRLPSLEPRKSSGWSARLRFATPSHSTEQTVED